MEENNKIYWFFFSLVPEIGPKKIFQLLNHFQNIKELFEAGQKDLKKTGLDEKTINNISGAKNEIDWQKKYHELEEKNIKIVAFPEENYPRLLKEIYSPPLVLYYKGKLTPEEYPLAVVGTRKTSSYGRQITEEIVRPLAVAKITIISGLALGIDTLAHQAALSASGRTIAVLGSGLGLIYPRTNQKLAEKIIESGGLIFSEFPPDYPPLKNNFPRRNRIISGLSLGTLIIEAPIKSGALITARYSLEQNREVFAVPGPIYAENATGTNNLIKMGAKAVTEYTDILEALNLEMAEKYLENKKISPETKEEKIILEILALESLHIDKIIEHSKIEPSVATSTLTIMEMKGLVKNLGGMQYTKAR